MSLLPFKENTQRSMGVELELQLIDLYTFNLTMAACDFLRRVSDLPHAGEFKPEITQSMLEINSAIHLQYESLLRELQLTRDILSSEAKKCLLGICGGGTHPFQKWKRQRLYQSERADRLYEQYRYLGKQFTIFGQHIHIACNNGNEALYLCHALAPYIPHFIALSASSPFQQGVDTTFNCSRLTILSAFPTSGTLPWILDWQEFEAYFNKLNRLDIVRSMKDFYWDIRPKPEYGTVEIRICDTPLTVEKAACLAAYAQMLSMWLLDTRPAVTQEIYLAYDINRFRAARDGLEAWIIDAAQEKNQCLADNILQTCQQLRPYAKVLQSLDALELIERQAKSRLCDSTSLKQYYYQQHSFTDVVEKQVIMWMGQ